MRVPIYIPRIGKNECVGCVAEGRCINNKRMDLCLKEPLSYCPCCTCSRTRNCSLQNPRLDNYKTIEGAGEILAEIIRQQDRFMEARIMPTDVVITAEDCAKLATYCHMAGLDKYEHSGNGIFGMNVEIRGGSGRPIVEARGTTSRTANGQEEEIKMVSTLVLKEESDEQQSRMQILRETDNLDPVAERTSDPV